MALKRIVRDGVFLIIAMNLLKKGVLDLSFYGIIIIFFTIYFYVGKKI